MTFSDFVCWDRASIDAVAPIDAAGLVHDPEADDAVFLATHHPIPIRRAPVDQPTKGELIDEAELLRAFRAPLGTDPHVFVIGGQVGTGKSHVVKWLHARCADRKDWHHVYVPKRDTNLRRVIASILDGRSGPKVDELRQQLDEARSSLTNTAEAARRVLTELAHAVEFPATSVTDRTEATVREHLPHLLRDPQLSSVLLREGGAIHRITRLGIDGLADGDEQDLFLAEADLPITTSPHFDPAILDGASTPAKNSVVLFNRGAKLRSMAIAVLNEELARAKARVLLGTGVDLIGVFTEVRRELAAAGLELALYVEDLVLLHGIDRELAQVFTEGRPPDGSLCGMRVAIAVTTGYLTTGALDTLRTRAKEHSLDLALGDDADLSRTDARNFVGRYLNAIRLGPERLAETLRTGVDASVPNRCITCPHQEPCHATFGVDDLGHGLYPLNAAAADRLIELAGGTSGRFDPREVVRGAVRDPLDVASDEIPAPRRTFPSARFGAALDPKRSSVPYAAQNALDAQRDGERHISLQAFWAPAGSREVIRLDDGIYTAFSLTPPDQGVAAATPSPTEPAPTHRDVDPLDRWATAGAQLPTGPALKARDAIFNAIVETIRSGPYGLAVAVTSPAKGRVAEIGPLRFHSNAVHIDAAAGGTNLSQPHEPVIERSVASAGLIADLLAVQAAEGSWEDLGVDRYVAVRSRIDGWVDAIVTAARAQQGAAPATVPILFATSQPGVGEVRSPGQRLEVIFATPEPDRALDRSSGYQDWVKAAERARVNGFGVIRRCASAAKTTGAPSVVDAAPLLAALRARTPDRSLSGDPPASEDLAAPWRTLALAQERASAGEWRAARAVTMRIMNRLGEDDRWPALGDAVQRALDVAHDNNLLAQADERDRAAELCAAVPAQAVDLARRVAAKTEIGPEALWDVLDSPIEALEALDRYLACVVPVMDRLDAVLGALPASGADEEVRISELTADLHRLADGLAAIGRSGS